MIDNDPELAPWVYGVLEGRPTPAGGFLRTMAEAAQRADMANYAIMRPVLMALKAKYPEYNSTGGSGGRH